MNKKNTLLLWVLAFGLYFLIMPLRGYSFFWTTIAHSLVFMILTWWALKKYAPTAGFWRPLIPMLAPWLFELAFRCILSITIWSLPVTILPQSLASSPLFRPVDIRYHRRAKTMV